MTSDINRTKNAKKGGPPKRTRSRTGRGKGRDSEINWMFISWARGEIHPERDSDCFTIQEMGAGGCSTVADARLRATRKPTKTPADQTTSICSGARNEKDRINTKERTASTDQHLIGGGKEDVKLVLAVRPKEGAEFGGRRRRRRRNGEVKWSRLEIDLKTRDAERRNKK